MKIKINKKLLLFTSILILLSSLVGCVFWYQLPEKMPTHFNLLGQADGYNHKVFAIFGLPALMLLMHWLLLFLMIKDPKSSNISSKIQVLIYWIIPFVSCLSMISIYGESLGYSMMSGLLAQIFMGVLMIVIGNYLPKTHRNYIIGIRLPWTLESDKNWRKTHRLAGKIWVLGGLLLFLNSFVQLYVYWVFFLTLFFAVIIPSVYSYQLSKSES
ncbi:SdpI family protein [Streptococcus pseudopneumoniae]|uniref:SdpI family protein n=1 Tax=Streptococcus TaxID=1301 RepID=UPI0003D3A4A4|nr:MULTISPECIES: SdpI family protein [Streptococcus]ETE08986.1 hemolysin expression modulating protein [Streptococcus pseudopneumoniae G42]MBF9645859.1 SdpI family protein [Streptococcus pseudopneumoniae]MBF9656074.1 SdpI family protein [Streptococcus pseudopneumoniae]MBF9676755.1 SdpI family protein [Streptococcus pseudopneumoniae]